MNSEFLKIDAHGHFFKSFNGPESSMQGYWENAANIGVTRCVASPGPSPEYLTPEGLYRPAIWEMHDGFKIHYTAQIVDPATGKIIIEKPAVNDPYHVANERLLDEARLWNERSAHTISVMPIHHPYLDTDKEILELIYRDDVCAVKFHGIATLAGPESIRPSVINALVELKKPIIVHTDYFPREPVTGLQYASKINSAVNWAHWAIEHNVKTLLTHGARLSPETFSLIHGHRNIVVGCAPDLLLADEPERLATPTTDFMHSLLTMMDPEQIVFDIDYGWNVTHRNDWFSNDWNMHMRLENAAEKAKLSYSQLKSIYSSNAINFFEFFK